MKKMNILMQSLLGLCVVCFSLLAGCIHDDLSASASVDFKVVTVDAQANNVSFTITSNTTWSIASNEEWCTPTPAEGTGTTTINLVIDANAKSAQRTANLALNCGGKVTDVEVVQKGMVSTLEVSPKEYTVDNDEQSLNIAVMANVPWTAVSSTTGADDDWLSINSESGANNSFVTATVKENDTYKDREGVITFYANVAGEQPLVKTVKVTQLSQGLPKLILAQQSIVFAAPYDTKYVTYVTNISDIVATSDFEWCETSVEEEGIKIKVSTNTAVNSRTATVTVIGVVDGATVSSQIMVSQSGVGAPEITLLKEYASVSYEKTTVDFQWINVSGAAVSLGSSSPWITPSISGNKVSAEVAENDAAEPRTGYIELIASNVSGQCTYYYVTIYQAGVGSPMFTTIPASASLPAKEGSSKFVVTVNETTGAKCVSASASVGWINNLKVTPGVDAVSNSFIVSYDYPANDSDASRSGLITLKFKVGGQEYLHTISVLQAGLGAPSVSSMENIFLQCDQTKHEQTIWLLDGDDTNVTFQVAAISYSTHATGTGSNSDKTKEWITGVEIADRKLSIKTEENFESEERYGEITIFATRDDSTTVLSINVTQGAHAGAGISGLQQELFVDWAGGEQRLFFSALNNSKVDVVDKSLPSWIKDATIGNIDSTDVGASKPDNDSEDVEGSYDKRLIFTVKEYYGGEKGPFREGIITLKVDNGNSNAIYYDVKVCQYEPAAALANVPDEIYLTYNETAETTLDVNLKNNAKIIKAYTTADWLALSSPFKNFDASTTSLTYEKGVDTFTYTATQFDGATDKFRKAYIYVTVQNNNANTMTYKINVTQGEPLEPIATVPETIYLSYDAYTAKSFMVDPDSSVTDVKAWLLEDGEMSMLSNVKADDFESASKNVKVTFDCSQYDGKEGDTRTGIIVVQVTGDHANDQLYYVNIVQVDPSDASLSAIDTYKTLDFKAHDDVKIGIIASGDDVTTGEMSVKAVSSEDWLTILKPELKIENGKSVLSFKVDKYDDSTEPYREAVITLTGTSDYYRPVISYITVRQTAQGAAGITGSTSIFLDYNDFTTASTDAKTLDINLLNDSEVIEVNVTSGSDWLVANMGTDGKSVTYYAKSMFKGENGTSRTGTFVITVRNNNENESTMEVTVVQGAPDKAVATVPTKVEVGYIGKTTTFNIDLDASVSGIDAAKVVNKDDSYDWLTAVDATQNGENAVVKFTTSDFSGYDGDSRTATIMITVSGDHVNDQVYYMDVIQSAPQAAEASVTPFLDFTYLGTYASDTAPAAETKELEVTVSGSDAASATLDYDLDDMDGDWFHVTSTVTNTAVKTVKYTVDKYTDSTEPSRSAVLQLTTKADHYRPVISFVDIVQYAQGAAGVTGSSTIYLDYDDVTAKDLDFNLLNGAKIADTNGVVVKSGNDWLTATRKDDASVTYKADPYDGAEGTSRTGTFVVTVSNNNANESTIEVTVIQGAPAEAAATIPETIYVNYEGIGTTANPSSFILDLDNGVKSVKAWAFGTPWLTAAAPNPITADNKCTIEFIADANTGYFGERVGQIMVTVSGDHINDQVYYIKVVQGSPADAELSVPSLLDFTYLGTCASETATPSEESFNVSVTGAGAANSTIQVQLVDSNDDAWFTLASHTTPLKSKEVKYSVAKFTGSTEDSRTAQLMVTAKADNFRPVISYVDVVQYAQGAASMDLPNFIDIVFGGITEANKVTMTPNLKNGSTIESVAVSYPDGGSWLHTAVVTPDKESFTYYADAYEGEAGETRTATIAVTVENNNADTETKYITVNQGAAPTATVDMISEVSHDYKEMDKVATITPTLQNKAYIESVKLVNSSDASWLEIEKGTESPAETFTYKIIGQFNGAEGKDYREALIAVTFKNSNKTTVTKYLKVTQGAAPKAYFEMVDEAYHSYVKSTNPVSIISHNKAYITKVESSDPSWLKVGAADSKNSTVLPTDPYVPTATDVESFAYQIREYNGAAASREAFITVTVENDHAETAVRYLKVYQGEPNEPTLFVQDLNLDYLGTCASASATAATKTFTVEGNDVTSYAAEEVVAVDWLDVVSADDTGVVTYKAKLNTTAETRTATIKITATGDHKNTAVAYVYVTQTPQNAAGVKVSDIYVTSAAQPSTDYTPTLQNDAKITAAKSNNDWINVTDPTDGATSFKYDIEANTSNQARTGTITLTVKNSNSNSESVTIKVYQSAPSETSATMPSWIYANGSDTSGSFTVNPSVNASAVSAKVLGTVDWLTITSPVSKAMSMSSMTRTAIGAQTVSYTLDSYAGTTSRKATIEVTIKSYDAATNDQIYYVYVEQSATDSAIFSAPTSRSYGSNGTIGLTNDVDYIDYSISGVEVAATSVSAVSSASWLTMRSSNGNPKGDGVAYSAGKIYYKVDENTTSEERSATITLTTEVKGYRGVVRYLTITQSAMGAYTFSIQSEASYGNLGTTDINEYANKVDGVAYSFDGTGDYSKHKVSATVDADWVVMSTESGNKKGSAKYTTGSIYYNVESNTTAEPREATITLKSEIEGLGSATTYLKITQEGQSALTLNVDSARSYDSTGSDGFKLTESGYTTIGENLDLMKYEVLGADPDDVTVTATVETSAKSWVGLRDYSSGVTNTNDLATYDYKDGIIFYRVHPNTTGAERTATITMVANATNYLSVTKTLTITQRAADENLISELPDVIPFKVEGETYELPIIRNATSTKLVANVVSTSDGENVDWTLLWSENTTNTTAGQTSTLENTTETNQTLEITAADNSLAATRTALIRITATAADGSVKYYYTTAVQTGGGTITTQSLELTYDGSTVAPVDDPEVDVTVNTNTSMKFTYNIETVGPIKSVAAVPIVGAGDVVKSQSLNAYTTATNGTFNVDFNVTGKTGTDKFYVVMTLSDGSVYSFIVNVTKQ